MYMMKTLEEQRDHDLFLISAMKKERIPKPKQLLLRNLFVSSIDQITRFEFEENKLNEISTNTDSGIMWNYRFIKEKKKSRVAFRNGFHSRVDSTSPTRHKTNEFKKERNNNDNINSDYR